MSGRSSCRRCADLRIGVQVDLHVRVGRDHGSDVAALDDRVPQLGKLALAVRMTVRTSG